MMSRSNTIVGSIAIVLALLVGLAVAYKAMYGPIASHKYTSNVKDIAYSKVCIDGHQYLHITDEGTAGNDGKPPIPRASAYVVNVNDDGTPVKCGL